METDKVPNTIAILNSGKVEKYHFNSLFGFACFILKDSKFFVFILDSDTFFSVIERVNESKHQMVIITSLSRNIFSSRKELERKLVWVKSDEMHASETVYSPSPNGFKYDLDDYIIII